jgi:hypothetical protein
VDGRIRNGGRIGAMEAVRLRRGGGRVRTDVGGGGLKRENGGLMG